MNTRQRRTFGEGGVEGDGLGAVEGGLAPLLQLDVGHGAVAEEDVVRVVEAERVAVLGDRGGVGLCFEERVALRLGTRDEVPLELLPLRSHCKEGVATAVCEECQGCG